jgi:hypothetical protein
MPLETGSFINDLTATNPLSSDPAGQGDDHLRLIKATVQGTLPQMGTVFGRVTRQDVAVSISSTWNTNHFICSASATATVVLTLPPAASITTGWFTDITTIGTGTVSLLPSGAASINGGVSLSIPRLSSARAYFLGGTAWLADVVPHAQGGTSVLTNLAVDGALSVSGATILSALTVNGVATMSAAVHMKSTLSVSGACVFGPITANGATSISGSCFVNGALSVAGTTTISGTLVLSIGQIKFPAAQVASADANTLDDYEEGTWTPVFTFATPGNVSVTYSTRIASYTKIGRLCYLSLSILTATFTHTSASGDFQISGVPFAPATLGQFGATGGASIFNGFNATTTIDHIPYVTATPVIKIAAVNQGTPTGTVILSDVNHTTGNNCNLYTSICLEVA